MVKAGRDGAEIHLAAREGQADLERFLKNPKGSGGIRYLHNKTELV